jgi:PBSX family phage terminase large subunit
MIWKDPILPKIVIPSDLKSKWFQLGSAKYQLLPHQYEFLAAKETEVCSMGGYGSAKTFGGVLKVAHLAMFPNNRGIVGRFASTDLEDTTERDLLDFLHSAELLHTAPNQHTKKAIVRCVDPVTQRNLGYFSEISFQHMDDPKHLRGRHIGYYWIDEASEVHPDAKKNLDGRTRWKAFAGRYQKLFTGNPEGHNYLYDRFFNKDEILKAVCGHPECTLSQEQCNIQHIRLKRRGIHAKTFDNYFLAKDYIEDMLASYSPNERQRYMDGDFDIFEGAAFREFDRNTHVLAI